MPADPENQRVTPRRAWALVAIVLLGGVLRVHDLGHSLWADELHTAWCVAGDFEQVSPRSWLGNQAPLYFWIVWTFQLIFGNAEWALRLPSVLAGLATIPLALVVGRWITQSSTAGLLAALLAATSPTLVYFSQEARVYAIVQCLALLQVGLFFRAMQRPTWIARALGVAASVALFYLHYTTALLFVAEGVWYIWRSVTMRGDRPPGYRWPWFVGDVVVIGVCCAPAAWHLSTIAAKRQEWAQFVPAQSWRTIGETLTIFPLADYIGWPLLIATALWLPGRLWIGTKGRDKPVPESSGANDGAASLLLCWYFVPVGMAWLATLAGWAPIFFQRYVMSCALAPLLASAWLWRRFSGWPAFVFLCVALVAPQLKYGFAINYLSHGGFAGHFQEDWRGAIGAIRRQRLDESRGFPVFVQPGMIEADRLLTHPDDRELRDYLLFPVQGPYRLADDRRMIPLPNSNAGQLSAGQIRRIKRSGGAWFLLRGANSRQTIAQVQQTLATAGISSQIALNRRFRGLLLARIDVIE